MKLRLLLPALATAFALTGCVAYEDYYGYGPGYYRSNAPGVVYRRYGGYPYGYYDGYYYGGGYYGGYPYGYRYGYPYYDRHYVYPRYYHRPRYPGHGGYRPPSGGGSKPPWRDLNRLRPGEGPYPAVPPRASRPPSPAPVYRPPSGSASSERREEARRARIERKTQSHREER